LHVLILDTSADELRSISDLLKKSDLVISAAKSIATANLFLEKYIPDILLVRRNPAFKTFIHNFCTNPRFEQVPIFLMPEKNASSVVKSFVLQEQNLYTIPTGNTTKTQSNPVEKQSDQVLFPPQPSTSFPTIDGIDWDEAIKNSGGASILQEVLQKFYDSIEDRKTAIKTAFDKKDWKNYTVHVHSLKSAARLIGALELSQDARQLEAFGNCQSEDEINEKTPQVLDLLVSFKQKLEPVVKTESEKKEEENEKTLIDDEYLAQALRDLRECLTITDFDSADFIIQELDKYRIPEGKQEIMARIKKAVSNVDKSLALELLEDCK